MFPSFRAKQVLRCAAAQRLLPAAPLVVGNAAVDEPLAHPIVFVEAFPKTTGALAWLARGEAHVFAAPAMMCRVETYAMSSATARREADVAPLSWRVLHSITSCDRSARRDEGPAGAGS